MAKKKPIRVLSVEDSAFFRRVLTDLLGKHGDIDLVGCANDPYEARDRLMASPVDVMTLDLDLPRMGGMTFLKLIMERKPMPVIVLSSQAPAGSRNAKEALKAGAAAVIEKPTTLSEKLGFGERLVADIKLAATGPLKRNHSGLLTNVLTKRMVLAAGHHPRQIIALGASTGGTQALEEVLGMLPGNLPGILVVQHIPSNFSASFAARLNRSCAMEVREAHDGDVVHSGLALVAPGGQHMEVQWIQDHYEVALHKGPPVEHQRPSVNVLFQSLAKCAGAHTVAALLTGMGRDGAMGMKQLHDLRAFTIAQDAGSSVVYGMARTAVEYEAVDSIVPLGRIADEIVKALHQPAKSTKSHVHR